MDVNGDIATYGTYRIYSDRSLKTNISSLTGPECLSKIIALKSYTYHYNSSELPINYDNLDTDMEISEIKKKTMEADLARESKPDSQLRIGFMAQELEKTLPNLVKEGDDGLYTVDYISLIPLLTEGMKEQQKIIEELNQKVLALEQQISALKK